MRAKINPEQKIKFTEWCVGNRDRLAGKTCREVADLSMGVNRFAPAENVIRQVADALAIKLTVRGRTADGDKLSVAKVAEQVAELRAEVVECVQAIDDVRQLCEETAQATRSQRDGLAETTRKMRESVFLLAKRVEAVQPDGVPAASWRPDHAVDGNGQGGTP